MKNSSNGWIFLKRNYSGTLNNRPRGCSIDTILRNCRRGEARQSARIRNQELGIGEKGEGLTTKSAKGAKRNGERGNHGFHGWVRMGREINHRGHREHRGERRLATKERKATQRGRRAEGANQELFLTTLRLIRLRRNRIASRRGILLLIILLESSSILLPQASSEALFDLISVVIRVICGRFCVFCAFCGYFSHFLFLPFFALLATLRESIPGCWSRRGRGPTRQPHRNRGVKPLLQLKTTIFRSGSVLKWRTACLCVTARRQGGMSALLSPFSEL